MATATLDDAKREFYLSQLGYTEGPDLNKSIADLEREFFQGGTGGGGGYVTKNLAETITGLKTIQPSSASSVGLIVKGAASQTANLQEWQNSVGSNLAKVSVNGSGMFTYGVFGSIAAEQGAYLAVVIPSSYPGLLVKGAVGQTHDLQQWQDSVGNNLARLSNNFLGAPALVFGSYGRIGTDSGYLVLNPAANGGLYFGESGDTGVIYVRRVISPEGSTVVALRVKGVASQTANLQEWQDSAGAINAYVTPAGAGYFKSNLRADGNIWAPNSYVQAGDSFFNNPGNPSSALFVGKGTTWPVAIVKGILNQSADLQQWQNSAATVLASVKSDGVINGTHLTSPFWSDPLLTGIYFQLTSANAYINRRGNFQVLDSNVPIRIFGPAASENPLIVRGAASQTADIQQWQSSAGAALARIESSGRIIVPAQNVKANAFEGNGSGYLYFGVENGQMVSGVATQPAFLVQGAVSQSADLQQWKNSAGTVLSRVTAGGVLSSDAGVVATASTTSAFGGSAISAVTAMVYSPSAAGNPLIVRGAASQTGDLQQWQNSAGARLVAVEPTGILRLTNLDTDSYLNFAGSPSNFLKPNAVGSVALAVRGLVSQTADLQQWHNSAGTSLAKITAGGSLILISDELRALNTAFISPTAASSVGLRVQGAASQTADLQRWQNSGGSALFGITSAGIPAWQASGNQQTTVGPAGAAAALPATPSLYMKVIGSDGLTYVIPAYAAA